jgi:hypothetical protein
VEVLGTQGTNPLGLWRVTGPQKNLQKSYDKAVKGSVYASAGGGLKLQAPKDEKSSLGLLQPYLVLQVSLNQVSDRMRGNLLEACETATKDDFGNAPPLVLCRASLSLWSLCYQTRPTHAGGLFCHRHSLRLV